MAEPPKGDPQALDLILLHPAGSQDPQRVSLAIGVLEWLRLWFANRNLRVSLWPETAVDAQGHRRFILRPSPWRAADVRRKLDLAPPTGGILYMNILETPAARAELTLEDPRGDRLAHVEIDLESTAIYESLPMAMGNLLKALDRSSLTSSPAEMFQTQDSATAIASLYALERLVAFQTGVGSEEPRRLFEPVLHCLAREPQNPIARECLTRMSSALVERESPDGRAAACEALERWCDLAPLSAAPPFFLAVARRRSGASDAARSSFEEALRRDPNYLPALQGYADWLAEHGFVDQGVGVLRQALGRTPFEGNLLDQAGCLLANAGRLGEAEPMFQQAIRAQGPPTARTNLARALMNRGEDSRALEILKTALEENPEPGQLELIIAIADRGGMVGSSAKALLRGRIADGSPNEEIARLLTAWSLDSDGPQVAAPKARRLLEIAASPHTRRFAHLVLLRAAIPDFDARWDEAVRQVTEGDAAAGSAFFEEVVGAQPEFGRARFLLALGMERAGRLKDALPHLERAAAAEGDDPNVLDLLARSRSESGDNAGAAQVHNRAASLAPGDARILRNAAASLLRAGFVEEAIALGQASLNLKPDQQELRELIETIVKQRGAHPKPHLLDRVARLFGK